MEATTCRFFSLCFLRPEGVLDGSQLRGRLVAERSRVMIGTNYVLHSAALIGSVLGVGNSMVVATHRVRMSVAKATLGGMAFAASIIAFIGVVAIAFVGPMFVFASVFESVLAVIVGLIIGTILACGCITGVSALLAPQ